MHAGFVGGSHETSLIDATDRPGFFIHVGIDSDRALNCEAWEPADNSWRGCGSTPLQYISQWRVQLGLLPDGRVIAIANKHEILVLDEASSVWTPWRAEWSTEGMTYGAPIRSTRPLARIFDQARGQWVEINDTAARFWQTLDAQSPSLLWDGNAALWAYVFLERRMGRDVQHLPDGCAISTQPLALFDAVSGKVRPLIDPGFGVSPGESEMLVLRDGTVVVAGVSSGAKDPGAGFFHRKASCAGFEELPGDDAYIAGGLAVDEATAAVAASASASDSSKVFVYGLCLIFVVPAIVSYLQFNRATTARACEENPKACLDPKSGLIRSAGAKVESSIPCRMVGVWSSRQGGLMHRIELKDDGSYAMEANALGIGNSSGYTGHGVVQGKNMVWRHDQGGGELDVNPILADKGDRFTLVEGNGRHTNYELIRAVASKTDRRSGHGDQTLTPVPCVCGRSGRPVSWIGASRIAAMIFSSPPQFGQCARSLALGASG